MLLFTCSLFTETIIIHTQIGDDEFNLSEIEQLRFEGDVAFEEVAVLLGKIPIKFLVRKEVNQIYSFANKI